MPRKKLSLIEPEITPETSDAIQPVEGQPEGVYEEVTPDEPQSEEEPDNILHMIPRGEQLAESVEEEEEEEPADPYGDLPQEEDGNDGEPPIEEIPDHASEEAPPDPLPAEEEEEEQRQPETFKGTLVWANLRHEDQDPLFARALAVHATIAFDLRHRQGKKVPSTPPERMEVLDPQLLRATYGHKIIDMGSMLGDAKDGDARPHEFEVDWQRALEAIVRMLRRGYHLILFDTGPQVTSISRAYCDLVSAYYPAAEIASLQEFALRH